jgi:putative membrane protein
LPGNNNSFISLFLKSIPLGLANTLPGVSGGTIALVLNIYETLINAIKKINLKRLIPIGLGAVLGVYIGSSVITDVYASNPILLNYFLFGLVITSAHSTYKKMGNINFLKLLFLLIAFVGALLFSMEFQVNFGSLNGYLLYFIAGFIGSIAMILPGISGGTILVLMGVYHPLLTAINNLDILFLFVFAVGVGLGLLVFANLFSLLLKNHYKKLMTLLTGLILGSSAAVFPSVIIINGIFAFIVGAVIIIILEIIGENT